MKKFFHCSVSAVQIFWLHLTCKESVFQMKYHICITQRHPLFQKTGREFFGFSGQRLLQAIPDPMGVLIHGKCITSAQVDDLDIYLAGETPTRITRLIPWVSSPMENVSPAHGLVIWMFVSLAKHK